MLANVQNGHDMAKNCDGSSSHFFVLLGWAETEGHLDAMLLFVKSLSGGRTGLLLEFVSECIACCWRKK